MNRSSGVPTATAPRGSVTHALARLALVHARALSVGAASLALLTLGCGNAELHGASVLPRGPAPDISAEDTSGGPFQLHDQRGRIIVLSFGYTSCPDVCPTTLSKMKDIYRRLGEKRAGDVTMAFLSVDPERDTVARLREYVSAFDPKILGLRLTGAPLASTLVAYGVTSERRELPGERYPDRPLAGEYYSFDHTSGYFVIDKAGYLRLRFPAEAPVDDMVSDLLALAAEGSPR
jgi:protein SCO1/2